MKEIGIRRSVREYSDKVVEKEDIEKILRSAMQAPSACNQQGTRFLVVDDKALLNEVSSRFKTMRFANMASFIIVFLIDKTNLIAPQMATQDASAATQNAMLEAVSLGIGSCWCGVCGREERVEEVKKLFNLKENLEPFSIVTFGYPLKEDAFKYIDRYDAKKVYYNKVV